LNARSLINKFDSFLDLLKNLKLRFSIIAITETWSNISNESILSIPGYVTCCRSRIGRQGGGVALFIHSDYSFLVRNELTDLCNFEDTEALFVDIFDPSNVKSTVGVVYRPPDGNMSLFNENYCKVLDKLSCAKSKCYIAGDFNINLLNYDRHFETENFLNNTFSHFFFPLISRPTRFSSNSSTLIDNIFTNHPVNASNAGIIISDLSDHLPVFYILDKKLYSKKNKYVFTEYRELNKPANIRNFTNKLLQHDWSLSLHVVDHDVNNVYNNFLSSFSTIYDECFPIITKTVKYKNINKPWITSAIIKSTKRKNYLYRYWLCKRTESSLTKYKNYKNKLTGIVRAAEKQLL
jgi:hypothetical protein